MKKKHVWCFFTLQKPSLQSSRGLVRDAAVNQAQTRYSTSSITHSQPGQLFTINASLSILLHYIEHHMPTRSWHVGIWHRGGIASVEPCQACFKPLVSAVMPAKLARYGDQQIALIVSDRIYTRRISQNDGHPEFD